MVEFLKKLWRGSGGAPVGFLRDLCDIFVKFAEILIQIHMCPVIGICYCMIPLTQYLIFVRKHPKIIKFYISDMSETK